MVHIDRIQLRYFKSFRTADIELSKGFVALAGPNGSGKSNICDGIRFALGENSLKALRAKKVSDLIMQGSEKAEIRLHLRENGRRIEVRRVIRNDGKTKYRYNGKRMTRIAVMDALRPIGAQIGDHNVIAQGEVEEIVKMSPKERRAIIDTVSGIAEFEEKKTEAMRELGKVDNRINEAGIVLKEREGFLEELEKEKDEALRYKEINSGLHRMRGSLISAELNRVNKEHTRSLDRFLKLKKRIEETKKEMDYKRGQMAELGAEKNRIVDEINMRSRKDEAYREIEGLRASVNVDGESLEAGKVRLRENEGRISELCGEEKELKKKLSELESEMAGIKAGLKEADAKLKKHEKERDSYLKNAGEAEANFAEARRKLEETGENLEQVLLAESRLSGEISKEKEIMRLRDEELGKLKAGFSAKKGKESGLEEDIREAKEAIKRLSEDANRLFGKERSLNKEIPDIEKNWLKLKERISELSARIGPSSVSAGLKLVLSMRDGNEVTGIHGTVAELCRFKPEHATAIEASAGRRMEYVVVDSVNVASRAIARLKKTRGGRCTFIPLDKISGSGEVRGRGKGLGPLIDVLQFDERYRAAFRYVFGGTLLVNDVESARKIGVGKMRMVTLDGDIFELSGAVTGGTFKPRFYLKEKKELEGLEVKASALKSERESLLSELRRIREEMAEIRHEKAEKEVKLKSLEIELDNAIEKQGAEDSARKHAKSLEKQISDIRKRVEKLEKESGELKTKRASLESEKSSLREIVSNGEKRDHEKMVGDVEKAIADCKSQKSSLEAKLDGKEREMELVKDRASALSGEITKARDRSRKMEAELRGLEERIAENSKMLDERERAMEDIGKEIEKLFEKRNGLDKSISELAVEVGKMEHSYERASKEMNEIAVSKATFETKLADLKAEFEKYPGINPVDASREELELGIRDLEAKLDELGDVNLRAPEIYEERKKDMEEIRVKMEKLSEEKIAIVRVIEEIDGKKKAVFMETFNKVNDNFKNLFKHVFKGDGFMALDQPAMPFESGLHIRVREDKREKSLESMSGGEKSLLTLLFIFALHMYKPAPFYLLDEVEAALDKGNSKKLASLLKQLSGDTQFIMVTHNDQILSSANIALGVTRTADGSKVVGIQLK